jgi:glutamine synthetase
MLSTKLGQIKTWKIKRSNSATDRSTTLWMAPEYEFMLVRFEQTGKDNKGFSLMIEEAQLGGETIFEF